MRFSLLPKQTIFFDLLQESSANLKEAAAKLLDLMENYENIDQKVSVIKEIYSNRKILLDKGKSGHDFAHKNHNSLEAAKKVIRTYEKILAKD